MDKPKTGTLVLRAKEPDAIYHLPFTVSRKGMAKLEFGEYFTVELEVDKDLNVLSGKLVKP